jgi:hypothetical protein
MLKITLGVVNEGESISAMSVVSLWTNYTALKEQLSKTYAEFELGLCIVSNDPNSVFCEFAKFISPFTNIVSPSPWNSLGFPPMSNGSHATYWKFDLIDTIQDDEILVYVDADAFILGNLDIQVLVKRLQVQEASVGNHLLMVPSHRPVLERVGYNAYESPFQYYNAGFFVGKNLGKVNKSELKRLFEVDFFNDTTRLFWHDQDLLNSYFAGKILSLPYRFNVSTGMLNKNNFGVTGINYLGIREITNVVVAHASGGILFKKKHYTYRDLIYKKGNELVVSLELDKPTRDLIIEFLSSIKATWLTKQFRYLQNAFSRNGLELFSAFDSDFFFFKLKRKVRLIIRA